MNTAQRATTRVNIFIAGTEAAIQITLPHNKNIAANGFENALRMLDQGRALQLQKGLVGAHAGTPAPRQNESGNVGMHDLFSTQKKLGAKKNSPAIKVGPYRFVNA